MTQNKKVVFLALIIIDECISCDACFDMCPVEAIEPEDPIYVIDPKICCECVGYEEIPSCVPVCPVEAIIIDTKYPRFKKIELEGCI